MSTRDRALYLRRKARAPREPKVLASSYARTLHGVTGAVQKEIRAILYPVIERELSGAPGITSAPDLEDATIGPRTDSAHRFACKACGASAPEWYLDLSLPHLRHDGIFNGPFSDALRSIMVAIGRLTSTGWLSPILDAQGRRIGEWNAREMSRVLGIDLTRREIGLGSHIETFRRNNVRLIQNASQAELASIEAVLSKAIATGARVEEVQGQIEERFNVSRSRATLIARDQTLKTNANISQLRQQNVGVTHYFWISSRDERVRGTPGGEWAESESNHYVLDGQRFSWTVAPITNEKKGIRNHPGEDYQCRCVAAPDTEALLGA